MVLFKWHEKLLITRAPESSRTFESRAKSIDSSNCAEIDLDCERENYCRTRAHVCAVLLCVCEREWSCVSGVINWFISHIENMKHMQMKTKVVYKIITATASNNNHNSSNIVIPFISFEFLRIPAYSPLHWGYMSTTNMNFMLLVAVAVAATALIFYSTFYLGIYFIFSLSFACFQGKDNTDWLLMISWLVCAQ